LSATDIIVVITPAGAGKFDCRVRGHAKVLCTTAQPLVQCARLLAARALHDPDIMLYVKHEGDENWSLRGKIAKLARVSVVERNRDNLAVEDWEPWRE
jgi:hypothetical protein